MPIGVYSHKILKIIIITCEYLKSYLKDFKFIRRNQYELTSNSEFFIPWTHYSKIILVSAQKFMVAKKLITVANSYQANILVWNLNITKYPLFKFLPKNFHHLFLHLILKLHFHDHQLVADIDVFKNIPSLIKFLYIFSSLPSSSSSSPFILRLYNFFLTEWVRLLPSRLLFFLLKLPFWVNMKINTFMNTYPLLFHHLSIFSLTRSLAHSLHSIHTHSILFVMNDEAR